ncbi:MAG: hypothetical protein ACK41C_00480 [Phenylobacterium sp.]|jgi:hypothetical protein
MPDLPLAQQIVLGGVVVAFTTFMVALAGTHIYVLLGEARRHAKR